MKCSQNYDFIFCLIMYMGWQFRLSLVSEAIAGKFNRRTSTLQVGLYHVQNDDVGIRNPTWTTPIRRHEMQFDICFPNYQQVSIDVTGGWAASLVNTRFPFMQLGRQDTHTLSDTHTHTHACTHAHAHAHTHTCTHAHKHNTYYKQTDTPLTYYGSHV